MIWRNKIIQGAVLLGLLLLSSSACNFFPPNQLDELEPIPDARWLGRILVKEYYANPVRFTEERVGQKFEFYGTVSLIHPNGLVRFHRDALLELGQRVNCEFSDPSIVSNLMKYDRIRVLGQVRHILVDGEVATQYLGQQRVSRFDSYNEVVMEQCELIN